MRSLADRIGNQTVYPDRSEDQREKREAAQHMYKKDVTALLAFDQRRHRHHVRERKLGVHVRNRAAKSGSQTGRVGICANHERQGRNWPLAERLAAVWIVTRCLLVLSYAV